MERRSVVIPLRVFLSYKVVNSDIVRLFSDWLRHNGIDCWFAEDRIPLASQTDDLSIDQAIRLGIDECTHALLFTNHRYALSDWCRKEFQAIRRKLDGQAGTILELCIPLEPETYRAMPDLERPGYPRLVLNPEQCPELPQVEQFLRENGWPLPSAMRGFAADPSHGPVMQGLGILGLTFDATGWDAEQFDLDHAGGGLQICQTYVREIRGRIRLIVQSLESPPDERLSMSDWEDDRALRKDSLQTAEVFRKKLEHELSAPVRVLSVHLCFLGSRAHLGISYVSRHEILGLVAARKYSLIAFDPQGNRWYELLFTFHVYGTPERLRALSPLMDAVVNSITQSEAAWTSDFVSAGSARPRTERSAHSPHAMSSTLTARLSRLRLRAGWLEEPPDGTLPTSRGRWTRWIIAACIRFRNWAGGVLSGRRSR